MNEVVFQIFQKESLQFVIETDPVYSFENKRINLIVKEYDDTSNNNDDAIINKFIDINSTNLSQEDLQDAINGILKININNDETNIDPTDYKFMIQETNLENTVANVIALGRLVIKDNYLK